MTPRLWYLFFAAVVISGSGLTVAGDAPEPAAAEEAALSGLVVVVNPATGEMILNPLPEQIGAVRSGLSARRLSRSTAGLVPFALSGGGRGVYLDGRFQSSLVLDAGPDGQLTMRCVQEPPEAVELGAANAEPQQPRIADR